MRSSARVTQHLSRDRVQPAAESASTAANGLNGPGHIESLRRVDWRFLLPDPTLGAVGYLGEADPSLLRALEIHASHVQVVDRRSMASVSGVGSFDRVVLRNPSDAEIRRAPQMLRDDGWLYCEMTSGGFRRARTVIGALRTAGCESLKLHWHYPNFVSCREIVPLDDSDAMEFLLRRKSRWKPRMAGHLVGIPGAAYVLRRLATSVSIVGSRPMPGARR